MNDRVEPIHLLQTEPQSGAGRVVAASDVDDDVDDNGTIGVQTDGRIVAMRLAVSCLIVPQVGDRIAWICDAEGSEEPDGTHWITQILARAAAGPVTLRLPRDATLACAGGTLRVTAGELHLEPDTLHVRTRKALFVFETAETIGACWQGVVTAMQWTGSTLTSVVDRLTTIAKSRLEVTEADHSVRAGHLDLRAEGLATVHAEHLLIEAERLVKTRAPQIHMG